MLQAEQKSREDPVGKHKFRAIRKAGEPLGKNKGKEKTMAMTLRITLTKVVLHICDVLPNHTSGRKPPSQQPSSKCYFITRTKEANGIVCLPVPTTVVGIHLLDITTGSS